MVLGSWPALSITGVAILMSTACEHLTICVVLPTKMYSRCEGCNVNVSCMQEGSEVCVRTVITSAICVYLAVKAFSFA